MSTGTKAAASIAFLFFIDAVIVFAGFVAPSDPNVQNRRFPFAPPARLRLFDLQGNFHFRPFVYRLTERPGTFGIYDEDPSKAYPIRFLVTTESGEGTRPHRHLFGVDAPGTLFLLGTDELGRDQLSRQVS